jgi:gluconokinase
MVRIVVMGVAGVGKSTVGRALAERLVMRFVDADELHSADDRAWMASGQPLDDVRRDVWIERVRDAMEPEDDVVVACSALRLAHRRRLRSIGGVQMVELAVSPEVIARRLAARPSHFFPATLLASQLAALDPPRPEEGVMIVDGDRPVDDVVDDIVAALGELP